MKSFSPIALCLLLVSQLANGFTPQTQQRWSANAIHEDSTDEASSSQLFSSPSLDSEVARSTNLDLPRNAMPFRQDKEKVDNLLNVEVGIGRVAMVAAVLFFGVEVTTDMSIPQQLASLGFFS